jgi:hypothetical protein
MSIIKKLNFQYAIGELILIFLGISLALSFDTWNDNRLLAKQEHGTLVEIREGIKKDLADIGENISGHTDRIVVYKLLIKHIEDDLPVSAELDKNISYLSGTTSFITNRAPYETLKARGIDIISNDTLRQSILEYYDIKQDWLVFNEIDYLNHHRDYIKPMVLKHISLKEWKIKDFQKFKEDEGALQVLYWAWQNDTYILDLYKDLKQFAESLIIEINAEIE